MKLVRIIEDCLVNGLHTVAGTVMNLDPHVASDLIMNNRAVLTTQADAVPNVTNREADLRVTTPDPVVRVKKKPY